MFNVAAILLLLIVISTSSTASGVNDLVNLLCRQTSDYVACEEALLSDPRTFNATDIPSLATIGLDLAVSNATEAVAFMQQMATDPSTSPDLQSMLAYCAGDYRDALESFMRASEGIKSQDYLTYAYSDVLLAMDGPIDCRDEMDNRNLTYPGISERYEYIRLLSDIGGALVYALMN